MNDPGGTVTERVVEEPAKRATGYGEEAVQRGARVAQGDKTKGKAKPKPKPSQPPTDPPHVLRARAIWKAAFGKDPQLANVRIADLKAHSDRHGAAKPGVGKLHGVGYEAWTNSKREVLVSTSLVQRGGKPLPDWHAELVLRHEAVHVRQFASTNDAVPTYRAMILAEADAYAKTVQWLDGVTPLPADVAVYDSAYDGLEEIVKKFSDRSKVVATELEDKAWMEQEGYLPPHAADPGPPARPLSLYVR